MRDIRMSTHEELKRILNYNPKTGIFTWKIKPCHRVKVGDTAGNLDRGGYIYIRYKGKAYKAHRLAVFWMEGEMPADNLVVMHDNGIRTDNCYLNLFVGTKDENSKNRKKYSNNSTGFAGVSAQKSSGKYIARINTKGENRYLGLFDTAEEASKAYRQACKEYGYHELHGKN